MCSSSDIDANRSSVAVGLRRKAALKLSPITVAILLSLGLDTAAQAQAVIDGGQTVTVPDTQSSPWYVPGTGVLTVGNSGQGTLLIHNGGVVFYRNGYLGSAATSVGTVTVNGVGSTLSSDDVELLVGASGQGSLAITNGGLVLATGVSNQIYIGDNASAVGVVTVDGPGSTLRLASSSSPLYVGYAGHGTLTIMHGGLVSGYFGAVGFSAGSVGVITVDGAGSAWHMQGGLLVGLFGNGLFDISNGGEVDTHLSFNVIGAADGGVGAVTVDGVGSTLTGDSDLAVGNGGQGTLTITHGGQVHSATDNTLGAFDGSVGAVTVDGAGSTFTGGGDLTVGDAGQGTLTIANGGLVSAGSTTLARDAGSTGTLNIGAAAGQPAAAPGTLSTPTLTFGNGMGELVFNHTDTSGNYTFAPAISGPGAVQVYSGDTAFTGNDLYTGGTTIFGGSLQLGNGGNVGSITGDVTDNGRFGFNRSDTLTFNGLISGTGAVNQSGTGTTVLTANNSYSGGTTITSGTLQVGNGGTSGALGNGAIVVNGTLAVSRSDTFTVADTISGTGMLNQLGTGTTILTGSNTYSGLTTISAGTLQIGNGGSNGTLGGGNVVDNGMLAFNRSDGVSDGGVISGTGSVNQIGVGGTTILTGNNTYSGLTTVSAGVLFINGNQSAATAPTSVAPGAALGGSGTIGGDVGVASGATLTPGASTSPGTLTINGNLSLNSGSILNYRFGQSGTPGGSLNDLTVVNGNLTLAGTLYATQSSGGTFGPGIYRLFDYTGTLINNGLTIGATSLGTSGMSIQFAPNQVNLLNTGGLTLGFWDGDAGPKNNGAVNGGAGTWEVAGSRNNWTDASGAVNSDFSNGAFATFMGTPGTVTINNVNGQVVTSGLQFFVDGYTITGGSLDLIGTTANVIVGDGTAASAGFSATIDSALTGLSTLTKSGAGTLILSGTNAYEGGTAIDAGTLQVGNGGATGTLGSGDVRIATDATLVFNRNNSYTFANIISGSGALQQMGSGTVVLTGDNTYSGGTTISAGALQLGNGGTSGAITGNVLDNGTLIFNRADTYTFGGAISGSGALRQVGVGGTTILTNDNTYTGGTTITANTTLQLGDGGSTGSIVGNVTNNGVLSINRSDVYTFAGAIMGAGTLVQGSTGTTVLTGNNAYGNTMINDGTLQIGAGGTSGTLGSGEVVDNSALIFNRSDSLTVGNTITGSGALIQAGSGTTVLTGTNAYAGPTTIAGGTLAAGATNTFSPDSAYVVQSAGTLDLRGYDQTVASLSNAGLVTTSGDPNTALTVTGNYIGQDGTLALHTYLAGDSSSTDHLVIGGTASGHTTVVITNANGPGLETTGDGIPVIVALNGATTAGAFALAPGELRAGAYDYRLFEGGIDGAQPSNWFLRSSFLVEPPIPPEPQPPQPEPPEPGEPQPPFPEVPPVLPTDPPPGGGTGPLPPGLYPIIGPELATYGVVQPIAQQLGRSTLGTYDDRRGDLADGVAMCGADASTAPPADACSDKDWDRPAAWGRVFGQHVDNTYRAFADPHADGNLGGVQFGGDLWRSYSADSTDRVGIYAAYSRAHTDVQGLVTNADATGYERVTTGTLNLNSWSGGAYWTHTWAPGAYLDTVFQGTHFYGDATTPYARLNLSGRGFIASMEGGYPFGLPQAGPHFTLEPQAQLLWQYVSFGSTNDSLGPVDLRTTNNTTARLGVRGQWTLVTDNGAVWQPYARINLWNTWGGNSRMLMGGDVVPLLSDGSVAEVGGGVVARLNANLTLFGQVDYQWAAGASGGQRDGIKGGVGVRYTF